MNYIEEINKFHRFLLTSDLSPSARLLWFVLMNVANSAGWKPKFNVAMSTLESGSGLKRTAIKSARQQLSAAGLIKVTPRKGRQSTLYEMIPVAAVKRPQSRPQDEFVDVVAAVKRPQSRPILKQNKTIYINKTKQGTAAAVDDQTWKEVIHFFESNIHPVYSLKERQDLEADVSEYGETWVKAAIEEAVGAGAFNMNYVEAVLKAWKAKGHMTRRKDRKKDQSQSDEAIRQAELIPF